MPWEVPGCQGGWGTTDNSIPTVETSPGTLTEVKIVGPTEADPAGWGTKEPPVILMWTSLPTARLWPQVSFQCSLGRNWGWPEPRTRGNNQSMGVLNSGPLAPNKTTPWHFLFLEAGVRAAVLQFPCYLSGSFSAQLPIPHFQDFQESCIGDHSRQGGESLEAGGKKDPFHLSIRILTIARGPLSKGKERNPRLQEENPVYTPMLHLLILLIPGTPCRQCQKSVPTPSA